MKITLAPPGETPQSWEFDPRRLMVAELDAIEKVTGLAGLTAFQEALNNWSGSALRALVWVLMKRQNPPLRFEAVDFAIADLSTTDEEEVPKDDDEEPSSSQALRSVAGG